MAYLRSKLGTWTAILIMAASIRAGQSWDLRLPYASLRVTLRVGTQKQPTFMHLLTGLRLQHPPRGTWSSVFGAFSLKWKPAKHPSFQSNVLRLSPLRIGTYSRTTLRILARRMLHKTDCEETSPQNGRRQERISHPVHCVHRARESPTGTKVRGRGCGADAGPGSRYSGRDALRVGALGTLSPRLGLPAGWGLSGISPGRDLDAFDGRTLRRRRI